MVCRYTNIGLPDDLPFHARVGIGQNAGTYMVEEEFLLFDAFFFLIKTRNAVNQMETASEEISQQSKSIDQNTKHILSTLNINVATYARISVTSFYSFVECFVNSIGEDFIARNPGLSITQQEYLRGTKKSRYISIENKIEQFPSIIREDNKSPIIISDSAQIVEPFVSFVKEVKGIRDASAHYNLQKDNLWRSPQEWLEIANDACKTCISVSRFFWQACYPQRPLPAYLGQLNETIHTKMAIKRLKIEDNYR